MTSPVRAASLGFGITAFQCASSQFRLTTCSITRQGGDQDSLGTPRGTPSHRLERVGVTVGRNRGRPGRKLSE